MNSIPTNRIEAFSDGVIAIIITVMVFDIKLLAEPTAISINNELLLVIPKIITYVISFMMLAIMWVNHHQLFHQIEKTDRKLLWLNIHLLFWMSLIPFVTNLVGTSFDLWQSAMVYSAVFLMCALAFTLIRNYLIKRDLLFQQIDKKAQQKIKIKNIIGIMSIYALAMVISPINLYVSYILVWIVPAMYFIPENIKTIKNE